MCVCACLFGLAIANQSPALSLKERGAWRASESGLAKHGIFGIRGIIIIGVHFDGGDDVTLDGMESMFRLLSTGPAPVALVNCCCHCFLIHIYIIYLIENLTCFLGET